MANVKLNSFQMTELLSSQRVHSTLEEVNWRTWALPARYSTAPEDHADHSR